MSSNSRFRKYSGLTGFLGSLGKAVYLASIWVLGFLVMASTINATEGTPEPLVKIYELSQSSLDEILAGAEGEAFLLYHLPQEGPQQPALVVHLRKEDGTTESVASVFDVPFDETHVPIEFIEGYPELPDTLIPAVTLVSPEGWWVRDGLVNYNLDIRVNGPIMAMWASNGNTGWARLVAYGEPNARIIVRDTDDDGVADWDWRTMLPEFPYQGYLRTTYAERRCHTPVRIERGPFPQWPFIAGDSELGYEQTNRVFRPPVVVDWATGRVQFFSEVVTLRNQNCSYGMYSIVRVLPGQMNSPDFEVPFAFYDLSGKGEGFPNLILRTGRTILERESTGLSSKQMEVIRYSWSNEDVGDGSMAYKVELFGFHAYAFETPIAGGRTMIDAPPYEVFPMWVIDRSWPVATFIDTEEINYLTSEGIYEWAPGDLGSDFYLGYNDEGNIEALADIRIGIRGEYRIHSDQQSKLYLSPIDNRLHLMWAEHGIWRLDEEEIIRVDNLDGDAHIDVWSREAMLVVSEEGGDETQSSAEYASPNDTLVEPEVKERLFALGGHLLHSGGDQITLVEVDYQPSLFETQPPTDHDTWEVHRDQLAPYEAQRRDPRDLHSWLDSFPGVRSEIIGATLDNLRTTGEGFRFELSLDSGYRLAGTDLFGLDGLAPGKYLVQNRNRAFTVTPLLPAQLNLEIRQVTVDNTTAPIEVTISNIGQADALGLMLRAEITDSDASVIELTPGAVDALAQRSIHVLLDAPSTVRAGTTIRIWLEDRDGQVQTAVISSAVARPDTDPGNAVLDILKVPLLLPIVGLFAVFLSMATWLAVDQRRGQSRQ